jgi:hypothetical protein
MNLGRYGMDGPAARAKPQKVEIWFALIREFVHIELAHRWGIFEAKKTLAFSRAFS